MMRTPLNPYEKYELTGMTDAERERETIECAENNYVFIHHSEPKTVDEILEELEEIFNGEL